MPGHESISSLVLRTNLLSENMFYMAVKFYCVFRVQHKVRGSAYRLLRKLLGPDRGKYQEGGELCIMGSFKFRRRVYILELDLRDFLQAPFISF